MTLYARHPRTPGQLLDREQLRVYMMCDGRRELGEVVALTRLDLGTVSRVVQELLGQNLLEAVLAPLNEEWAAVRPQPAPASPAAGLLAQLEAVLQSNLGARAEPFTAQLRACQDPVQLQEQAARIAVKLKLTVNRQVADQFSETLKTALA